MYEVRFDNIVGDLAATRRDASSHARFNGCTTSLFTLHVLHVILYPPNQGVVSMKTLLKNANCLQDFVSDNTKKVQEICDVPVFVPASWRQIREAKVLEQSKPSRSSECAKLVVAVAACALVRRRRCH